jgi:hypothetical protein
VSISTVRQIFEKPVFAVGCSAIIGIAIVIGLFQVSCMAGQNPGQQLAEEPVAKVGGQNIDYAEVDGWFAVNQSAPTPGGQAATYAQAIREHINAAKLVAFAKSKGLELTVDGAKEAVPGLIDKAIEDTKASLLRSGLIKENATDAEIDAFFRQMNGQDLATAREAEQSRMLAALDNPGQRDVVVASILERLVLEQYAGGVSVTDEQLLKSFENITHKKIEFASKEEADKALAEIKGGMSFEAAMDKYVKTPPPAGKKVSEVTQDLQRRMFSTNPDLAPVANLQAGEVSEVIDAGFGTYAIYKVISVKDGKPADYEGKKEQHRTELARALGSMQFRDDHKAFTEGLEVEWVAPGFEVLYKVDEALSGATPMDAAQLNAKLAELEQEAKTLADSGDLISQRPALLAQYYANERLFINNPNDKEILTRRIEVAQKMLQSSESIDLRLELVEQLADLGRGKEAADQLVQAARLNFDTGEVGAKNRQEIGGFLERLREEKTITDEQAKEVEAELKRWADEKKRQDEYEAQQKKADEEAKKQFEAEQKKTEAEAKNKAKAKGK